MRISLVVESPDILQLVADSLTGSPHHVVSACVPAELLQVTGVLSGCRITDSAHDAVFSDCDCVVIESLTSDESIARCRTALQADRHVILFLPADCSTAFSYELGLLKMESAREVRVVSRLSSPEFSSGDFAGTVRRIRLNATGSGSNETELARLTTECLLAAAETGAEFTQLTAMDVSGPDEALISRVITLSAVQSEGVHSPPMIITIEPAEDVSAEWVVETSDLPAQQALTSGEGAFPTIAAGRRILRAAETLQTAEDSRRDTEVLAAAATFCEAAVRSLRRRRTVDLYAETLTERSVFKTQMAAMGCGVLTWVLTGLIISGLISPLLKEHPIVQMILLSVWIAPVVLFLLTQMLLPLARGNSDGIATADGVPGEMTPSETASAGDPSAVNSGDSQFRGQSDSTR